MAAQIITYPGSVYTAFPKKTEIPPGNGNSDSISEEQLQAALAAVRQDMAANTLTMSNRIQSVQSSVDGMVMPDISGKADTATVTAALEAIQDMIPDVSNKADKSAVSTLAAQVSAIQIPDISGKADMNQVQSMLSSKANVSQIPDISGKADKSEVTTLLGSKADISALNQKADASAVSSLAQTVASKPSISDVQTALLSDTPPMAEQMNAVAGNAVKAPRQDHSHPRLTETISGTLNASGTATVTFMKQYDLKPAILLQSEGANAAIMWDVTYTQTGGKYTGATITGRKGRPLPTLTGGGLTLVALLTAVIGTVNGIVSSLSGFDPFNNPAANVAFTGLVIKSSQS